MAKHVLTTPLDLFRQYMARQPLSTLKRLKRELVEFKVEKSKTLPDEILHDIYRREAIIDFNIRRLVNLNEGDNNLDYTAWERKMNHKKKVY